MNVNLIEENTEQKPVIPQFEEISTSPQFDLTEYPAESTSEYTNELDALRLDLTMRLRENSAYDDVGLLAYWCLVVPLAGILALWGLVSFSFPTLIFSMLLLAIGKKFYTLADSLDVSRAAWQTHYLERNKAGLLVELLRDPDKRIASLAAMILTAILPHITPQESEVIDEEQRMVLYTHLEMRHSRKNAPLIIATLKSLEKIGDADAVPYVEQLALSNARSQSEEWIRESALICLPLLRRKIAEREAAILEAKQAATTAAPNLQHSLVETVEEVKTEAQLRAEARVQSLLKTLEEERKTHTQPGMRQFFNRLGLCTLVPGSVYLAMTSFGAHDWVSVGVWTALGVVATQLHRFTLSPKQIDLAKKLAESRDVQAIGPLAEMLEWPDLESRHIAEVALSSLLPLVKANDRGLLTTKQRAILYRLLKPTDTRKYWQLQLALLEALEQIGDDAAVPYVEELAKVTPRSGVQKRVKDRADACLPFLSEKAEQSRHSQMLLRGSSVPTAAPETLLRPATENPETRPQELLRPGSSS